MARRAARLAGLVALAPALRPDVAAACAVCIDSAWGNRGFTWPLAALMIAPFAVAAGVGGVLAWSVHRGRQRPRRAPPPPGADPAA
jgi:hypothetical protein